ncbi:Conserved hypothetical protein [gamma proteobacterium HdN1]|nr:Conserved hypothetical protein [gamma proteobacterium HdN1]
MASFYENQQNARRKTKLLAFYFLCAVGLTVLAINLVLYYTLINSNNYITLKQWFTSGLGPLASLITLAVIAAGSIFKTLQIGSSGDKVAQMAGGVPLSPDTKDAKEQQLLNVVEEMALASGIKPPRIYILREESGINAFVAGLEANKTALAVTKGALDTLTRDELQGVIGHEFSHILNSDMRINVRMIGILAGILIVGQLGRILLQSSGGRTSNNKQNIAPLIGLGLFLIGSIGLFFGQIIKAALSRQREYLADASAVQFTRNPAGIGGALIKIRDAQNSSFLDTKRASELSHMCFGEVMEYKFNSLFATHPPLDLRIKAIDPRLASKLQTQPAGNASGTSASNAPPQASGFSGHAPQASSTIQAASTQGYTPSATQSTAPAAYIVPADVKQSVGQLTTEKIQLGGQIHQQLPSTLLEAAHNPEDACTLLYALLLASPQHSDKVNEALQQAFSASTLTKALQFRGQILAMPYALRLPLFDLSIPALRTLDPIQQKAFFQQVYQVINADQHYTLSECALMLLLETHLQPQKASQRTINSIRKVEADVITMLIALSYASQQARTERLAIFERELKILGIDYFGQDPALPSANTLREALARLKRLSPLLKKPLVDSAVDMVISDQKVYAAEFELLRAFCDMIDCPMPPVDPNLFAQ